MVQHDVLSSIGAPSSNEIHNTICTMNRIVYNLQEHAKVLYKLWLVLVNAKGSDISSLELQGRCRTNIICDTRAAMAFERYFSETRKCGRPFFVYFVTLALLRIWRWNAEYSDNRGRYDSSKRVEVLVNCWTASTHNRFCVVMNFRSTTLCTKCFYHINKCKQYHIV